jgi:hypothetical protein
LWIEMLDQHERHAAVRGHVGKKPGERLQPAGRCADANDQGKLVWR